MIKCPTCHQEKTNPLDIEAIEKIGECLSCDHIRAEIINDWDNVYVEHEDKNEPKHS